MSFHFDPASFRDPSAKVFHSKDCVYRAVEAAREAELREFLNSEFYNKYAGTAIIPTIILEESEYKRILPEAHRKRYALLLEHRKLEPITYPYEWPFSLLKRAAEFHLSLHLDALEAGYDLSDASAYNIQFIGVEPVFIDTLSFKSYVQGSYWMGYKQFCEQFLCPLLLFSTCGVSYNDWYRGALNGLAIRDLAKLLPISARLSPRLLTHIFLHARLIERIQSHSNAFSKKEKQIAKGLPLSALKGILQNMLALIKSLRPKKSMDTYWKNYEFKNSYSAEDTVIKRKIVTRFLQETKPAKVLDIGCNRGDFCELSLKEGAKQAVGLDFDVGALEGAVLRSKEKNLNFLPLYLDLSNPSPDQGWNYIERKNFSARMKSDALIALAVLHHLVIAKNIPMESAIFSLLSHAPVGLIEFVPKSDAMVQEMLKHRVDVFPDYSEDSFRNILKSQARIVFEEFSSASNRKIFCYQKSA